MLTLSAISARALFARHCALAAVLLFPSLAIAQERAPLVTYGPDAPSREGDDDHVQLIIIKVPEATKDKLYLRIFDADCGGLRDTIYADPDTKTRFSLFGRALAPPADDSCTQTESLGKLIKREAFGEDPALDNEWHTFAKLDPADGELVDGYVVFKLLVEGAAGNDGNSFDVAVSTSEARNVTPEGVMLLNDAPTLRLDGEGVAELRFSIPSEAESVTVYNFDTAGAQLTFDTAFRSVGVFSSAAQGETGETTIRLEPGEAGAVAAITFHSDGSETPNDATLSVSDSSGNAIPIELPIYVDRINRRPTQQVSSRPLADCRSIVFDATGTTDPDGDLLTYLWDFGDGQSGEGQKVVHRYDRPGDYVATVRIHDSSGRVGNGIREQLNIRVNQAPVARLKPNQTTSPGEPVSLDAAASSDPEGGPLVYFWDFGDGSKGKGRQVTHDFKESGRYKVSLRVEDDSGTPCNWDVAEADIWVNAPPVAEAGTDFVASVGETVTLDGGRSYDRDGTLTEWVWDLGDGTKRYGRTVEYAYRTPGKYEIALEVKDDAAATNSSALDRIQAFVNDPPVAEAGADLRLTVGGVAFFDASASTDSDGHIVSYDWDFGDGNRGKGEKTPYAFNEPGTYRVKLRVRDNSPAASGVGHDSLTVVVNAAPVAKAGPDQTVTTSEVRFDGSTSRDPDGNIIRYEWDFGDGTMGEGAKPVHVYQRAGIFHATLKVVDDSGTASSEAVDQITIVVNRRPAADAGPDRTVAPGDAVSFAAFESFDSDGEIVGYRWDFGDGATANGKAAKHSYDQPGSYLVRLTVNDNTDDPLAVDYDESVVKVNAQPITNAGPDILVAPGETVRLDGSGSFDTDGELTSFHWYFGDDGETVSKSVVERSFDRPGVYTAKLTVTDDSGVANSQATDTVTIHVNHAPQAVLGNDLHTCDGAISLDGSDSIDGDGQALTYEWDFGDGTSTFGAQVIHVYVEGGVYPVTLTVDDGTGLSNARHSSSLVATINRAPLAEPGPDKTVCAGEVAVFDGSQSSDPDGGALRYWWSFGDGETSDLMNPTKIYKKGGVYSASLRVEDTSGLNSCNAGRSQITVRVAESPTAEAGEDMTVCANSRVRFDGTASSDPDGVVNRFRWNFGDGATGGGPTPEHIFTEPGDYRVRLTVTGDRIESCDNTDADEIVVHVREAPVVRITGPDVVAVNAPATFDASQSVIVGAKAVSWKWTLGDTELDGEKVTYTFAEAGPKTVALTLTTDVADACTTVSAEKAVEVNLPPHADAGSDQLVGVNELVALSALESKDPDGAIVSYRWDFGDGNQDTGVQVRHRYAKPGQYPVTLTVRDDTDVSNNTSTETIEVTVNAPPKPRIEVGSIACAATAVPFSGADSSDPDGEIVGYEWSFGDGNTAEGIEASHSFATPGRYQVSLFVNDGTEVNNSRQAEPMILQVNHPPIAEAGPDRIACPGEEVDFDGGKSSDRDGQIVGYHWSFGDDSDAFGAKVTHVFTKPGNYQVELSVTDDSDARQCGTGTDEAFLRINAPPVAVAKEHSTLYTGGAHDAVLFDASGSLDRDDDALLHLWDFGDGTSKAGVRVFHAYDKPGQYTVRLTVKDGTALACGQDVAEFTLNVVDRAAAQADALINIAPQQ